MRPALATVVGITLTIVLAFAGQLATGALLAAPDGAPLPVGRTLLSATLALTFGASVIGGFVGAHLAQSHRGRVTLAVAAAAGALGVMSALEAPPDAPAPVAWALPVLAVIGALAGGGLRQMSRWGRSPA